MEIEITAKVSTHKGEENITIKQDVYDKHDIDTLIKSLKEHIDFLARHKIHW